MSIDNPRGYTEYRIGDRVRVTGDKRIGKIVEDIGGTMIVKYPEGDKVKTIPAYLDLVTNEPVGVTLEEFDEVVKDFLGEIEFFVDLTPEEKENAAAFVSNICKELRTRLFDGNE